MKYIPPLGSTDLQAAYIDGDESTGTEGSPVPAAAIEHPMRELSNIILMANLIPNANDLTQVSTAIIKLINENSDSAATEVGVPIPWPIEVVPAGYIAYKGQAFDKIALPKLALIFPSGILLDMRGEQPRGWDNGRGVDANRALLSYQSDAFQNFTGTITVLARNPSGTGAISSVVSGSSAGFTPGATGSLLTLDPSQQAGVRTATETRSRNVAFNYITRAA